MPKFDFPNFVFFGTDGFATAVLKEFAKAKIFPSHNISKADLGLVASYGKIIPPEILSIPKYGILNIHPSLLPKYRGPTPIQNAILNGDEETGVTLMLLDAELDHGPTLKTCKVPTLRSGPRQPMKNRLVGAKNFVELRNDLAKLGAKLFLETAPLWVAGKIKASPQVHSQATYTKKIKKEDGLIDLTNDPILNYQKFRAYYGWPGIYFFIERNKKRVRVIITTAHLTDDNQFVIDRVKPEGKKDMLYADFLRGFK
ncbi:MAG: methionyl-tRNA formyltransferase [Candidatus Vogelbacteria bacterium]